MAEDSVIVCRCEEVTDKEIVQTIKKYHCSSREVKLRTRAAMGYCGGRTCRYLVDDLLADLNGKQRTDEIPLRYRPPIRPVSFKKVGGE
ncbi:(2Fe-2S)-binding protein [Sporolactobacillus sp. THM7-7]|nr:(2Fe-2S)-binding protein [Sporolactobacillus sp. THM7-7]